MHRLSVAALLALLAAPVADADEAPVKPLPGNKPCAYPEAAQKEYVAGPVRFVAQVRPDGTVDSVDVGAVPLPRLGFEEGVRTCVSAWRFETAPGAAGLRRYEGHVRFRLAAAEEDAVRAVIVALADAWNEGDMKAVEDLALRPSDTQKSLPPELAPLRQQLEAGGLAGVRIKLESEFQHLRFFGPDIVGVGQPIRKVVVDRVTGQALEPAALTIDVFAVKGSRGWRLLKVAPATAAWEGIRVGGTIKEPRKTKNASPRYPEIAKQARIQGVVILECLITPEGKIAAVRVLRGIPLLDQAAIDAVKQWEYTPTLLDGKAVPVIMTVTVNFRLS